MRLIDADYFDKVLIDAQQKCAGRNLTFKYGFLSTVRANLERCPTVDAVRVVRCKDCKHWTDANHHIGLCRIGHCELQGYGQMCGEDFYCGMAAERLKKAREAK